MEGLGEAAYPAGLSARREAGDVLNIRTGEKQGRGPWENTPGRVSHYEIAYPTYCTPIWA